MRPALLFVLIFCGLALTGPGAAKSDAIANPWAGKWTRPPSEIGGSTGGIATLAQSGSTVDGSFNWGGGGTIQGTVSGSTLTGTWTMAGAQGTMTLTLSSDLKSFTGRWDGTTGTYAGRGGTWSGTYVGGRTEAAEAKPFPVRFSFRARGVKQRDGKLLAFAAMTGTGQVLVKQPKANNESDVFEVDSDQVLLRIAVGAGAPAKDVRLRVRVGGSYELDSDDLRLPVEVSDSDAPRCRDGDTGTLVLSPPDEVQLHGVCGFRTIFWVDSAATVSVRPSGR